MSNFTERISGLIAQNGGQEFKSHDFNALLKPGVYVVLRNGRPVYVGMGRNLLGRVAGKHHKRYLFEDCDRILLYSCNNLNDANELEELLISEFKPPFK